MTTKIEKIILEYKNAVYNLHGHYPKVERKGAWIYFNDNPTAHRSSEIPDMIKRVLKMIEEKKSPKELTDDKDYDMRKLLSMIKVDGKHIFRSTDIKAMQNAGKRIAKAASTILNELDKHDEEVVEVLSNYVER